MHSAREIWEAACGRAPEPWWMSLAGAAIVTFVIPALVALAAVALGAR